MAKKIGEKIGQIDIHKKAKTSFGEVLMGIAGAIVFILILVNLTG